MCFSEENDDDLVTGALPNWFFFILSPAHSPVSSSPALVGTNRERTGFAEPGCGIQYHNILTTSWLSPSCDAKLCVRNHHQHWEGRIWNIFESKCQTPSKDKSNITVTWLTLTSVGRLVASTVVAAVVRTSVRFVARRKSLTNAWLAKTLKHQELHLQSVVGVWI